MAIFGPLKDLDDQLPELPGMATALAYLDRCMTPGSAEYERVRAVATGSSGKVDLEHGLFAIEQAYLTKPDAEVRWEAHRNFADLQVVIEGEEAMEVAGVGTLKLEEDQLPERDVQFFHRSRGGSSLRIEAGMGAMFLPVDAHRPGLAIGAPGFVRKVVVKIPLPR